MIVGINGRFLAKPHTGIGQYTRSLLEALARRNPDDRFLAVTNAPCSISFPPNVEIVMLKESFPGTGGMKKTYWEQVQVPRFFLRREVDVVHFPYPSNPWKGFKKPVFVTVHDVIPWIMRDYRSSVSTRLYQDRCLRALNKATQIFTVSNASRDEIINISPDTAKKIIVTPNSVSLFFEREYDDNAVQRVLLQNGIDPDKPFLLYVGGYDARKNVERLAEVYVKTIAPHYDMPLVLAGGKSVNEKTYRSFDNLVQLKNRCVSDSLKGDLCFTGFVSQEDLPILYRSCFAFVNISRAEGFNLPLLEALCCKAVTVTSDLPVHHEVCGKYALYVDPLKTESIATTLTKLLTNASYYTQQKAIAASFRNPFSWDKTANMVMKTYRMSGSVHGTIPFTSQDKIRRDVV